MPMSVLTRITRGVVVVYGNIYVSVCVCSCVRMDKLSVCNIFSITKTVHHEEIDMKRHR